ncbi:MAG TPA: molecular chaperone DnaK [Chitinophagales bacterium]|nr:molecular chaperone DnaK [Chitinophagales bacterium]HRK28342.1 molecular chaperone DnaK [Chitinophagales bacterium]
MSIVSINLKTGTLATPETDASKEIIVGIDLGTTNSLVAYINPQTNKAIAIQDTNGSNKLVPSIVHFAQNGAIIVGNDAKTQLVEQPQNTIYSVKRLMGKAFTDVKEYAAFFGYKVIDDDTQSLVKIKVDNRFYTPIELSALILRQLKQRAEEALGQTITKAVITVPAYFNDAQRQATRDAGKLAGLDVLRIVNEPTAASLAYGLGLKPQEQKTIAVFDLGGGTFDISILHIDNGVFDVLATNGNTFLGGDDFDRLIMDYWINHQLPFLPDVVQQNKALGQELRLKAEEAKMALSQNQSWEGMVSGYPCNISRKAFEQLIQPLINQTIQHCKQALQDAALTPADIAEVVLVGGSTRVPAVKQAVADFFGIAPHDELNPDEVVALGAAVQADILAGNNKDFLLLDITPLSLGIETMGGLMDVIIARNSKVPTKAARQYTTQIDGQANMRITVYQGERDLVQDNRKLGEFTLKGIPAMPAGLPKVEIAFMIDADGILRVRAKELRSGVEQSIEVKPQYGLTEEQMAAMLLNAIQNAQSDRAVRALQEAINEAETILQTAEKFVSKNSQYLQPNEIEQTYLLADALRNTLASGNKDLIHQHIETLNNYTRPFAERIMDIAVAMAMKGKKV